MNTEPSKTSPQHSNRRVVGFLRVLVHNWPWKLLALFVAVCLWAGLISQDTTLTRERVFTDAKISINGADVLRRSSGLIVISGLESEALTARMRVDVPQLEYANVLASNYNPRVDLTRITETGEQTLRVLTSSSNTYGSVSEINPSTLTIEVDRYVTNYNVPVTVNLTGSYPDGFFGGALIIEPSIVSISGPATLVDRIARVCVDFDASSLAARAGKARVAIPIVFLDSDGEEVSSPLLEASSAGVVLRTILVQQTLFPTRRINLSTEGLTAGQPARGYRVRSVSVSPASVLAAGGSEELDALEQLYLDSTVNVTDARESFTQSLRLKKPAGLEYISTDSVTVSVEIEPVPVSRSYGDVRLAVRGSTSKQSVSMDTRTVDMALTGPQLIVENLKSSNLGGYVDVSGLSAGEYELPVHLYIDRIDTEGFTFQATPSVVTVTITEK